MCNGKKFLLELIAKLALANFLAICSMWPSQDKFSSKSLKYLSFYPIFIVKFCKSKFLFCPENTISFVFLTFNVSLLALNQLDAFASSKLAVSNNLFMSNPEIWNVVSSANNSVKSSVAFGRSFIKIKNNRGPRTEPWGTPHFIVKFSEFIPLKVTNCSLSDK